MSEATYHTCNLLYSEERSLRVLSQHQLLISTRYENGVSKVPLTVSEASELFFDLRECWNLSSTGTSTEALSSVGVFPSQHPAGFPSCGRRQLEPVHELLLIPKPI